MSYVKQNSLAPVLSRHTIQSMLQLKRLLLLYGVDIPLSTPDAVAQLLDASSTIADDAVQSYREHLLNSDDSCEMQHITTASAAPLPVTACEPSQATAAPEQPRTTLPCNDTAVADNAEAFASAPLKTVSHTTKSDVFLTCDRCNRLLSIKIKYLEKTQPLPVSCPCGMRFRVELDVRKYARKSTSLTGVYRCENSGKTGGIVVEDLSFGGIRFEVSPPHTIAPNDRLEISFTLDDDDHTIVQEYVCVQSVRDAIIGTTFTPTNNFNRALATYLMQ